MDYTCPFGFVWLACIVFGGMIGSYRQRTGLGLALGVFLGPIGVLIVCFVPPPEPPKYRRN